MSKGTPATTDSTILRQIQSARYMFSSVFLSSSVRTYCTLFVGSTPGMPSPDTKFWNVSKKVANLLMSLHVELHSPVGVLNFRPEALLISPHLAAHRRGEEHLRRMIVTVPVVLRVGRGRDDERDAVDAR